jgi:hypothetical protein
MPTVRVPGDSDPDDREWSRRWDREHVKEEQEKREIADETG